MRTIDINGLRVVELVPLSPTRPPILFIHGIMVGAWNFERMQPYFAERGYPTYAIDLRGHNGSRPVPDLGKVSLHDYVADALEVASWISDRHGGKPIVYGHSMGGLVTQKVAEAGAALAAVLHSSAPPRGIFLGGPKLLFRQIKSLPAILFSKPLQPKIEDLGVLVLNRVPVSEQRQVAERFVADSGRVARELSVGAISVDAGRVTCPVVSISSAEDLLIPPSVGRKIAQKYHAPYWILPEHGHFYVAEPRWEDVCEAVDAWLIHVTERLAQPKRYAELWDELRARIGDVVDLRFYDGLTVRAEVVNVDLAEHQDLIFEVREVLAAGPRHLPPLVPGETVSVSLGELVGFSRVE